MSHRVSTHIVDKAFVLCVTCLAAAHADAATVTSPNFSLGFGASVNTAVSIPGTWTTTETNGANTPLTAGNANATPIALGGGFTLTPTVLGRGFSSGGPTFPLRVLSGSDSVSGWSAHFDATLAAAFSGLLPDGASPLTTTLNITRVSIYAVRYNASVPASFEITEPLAGTDSPNVALGTSDFNLAGSYSFVTWNPVDLAVAGALASRNFRVTGFGDTASTAFYAIDGFEVEGNIIVTYVPVPEPSSLTLLGLGVAGMVIRRRGRP